jgi:hypothetical protein
LHGLDGRVERSVQAFALFVVQVVAGIHHVQAADLELRVFRQLKRLVEYDTAVLHVGFERLHVGHRIASSPLSHGAVVSRTEAVDPPTLWRYRCCGLLLLSGQRLDQRERLLQLSRIALQRLELFAL